VPPTQLASLPAGATPLPPTSVSSDEEKLAEPADVPVPASVPVVAVSQFAGA